MFTLGRYFVILLVFLSDGKTLFVYFRAGPIAKALDLGADIVITGRCTDSSMVLGPLMHELKWKHDEWDKLATGR